jgi:alpha-tubulin suppressor-like RCC1 family protein
MRRFTMLMFAVAVPMVLAGCAGDTTGRGQAGARGDDKPASSNPIPDEQGNAEDEQGEGPEEDGGVGGDTGGSTDSGGGSTDSGGGSTDGGGTDAGGTEGGVDGGSPASGFIDVATALSRACRVRVDGTVECWGANYGELGFEPTNGCGYRGLVTPLPTAGDDFPGPCTPTPTVVPGLTDVVQVAMGRGICALRKDGTVACWGFNEAGELGVPATDTCRKLFSSAPTGQKCTKTPTTVAGLTGVVQLAVDYGRMCARRGDGTVACWGWNQDGELGVPRTATCGDVGCTTAPTTIPGITTAVDLGVGYGHSCVVLADGTARCWGLNADGQLGITSAESCSVFGTATECARTPAMVPGLVALRDIDAGSDHTCAVDALGALRCWGDNRTGELGDGTKVAHRDPRIVTGVGTGGVAEVYTGPDNTCVRKTDGTAMCWGVSLFEPFGWSAPLCSTEEEEYDECQLAPRAVPGVTNLRQIAVDQSYACYLRKDGTLECKGDIIGFRFGV